MRILEGDEDISMINLNKLFFEEIKEKFADAIIEKDLYQHPFSDIYNLSEAEDEEVSLYLDNALETGNKVLELCCGNGRLTIPFAKYGFDITGIDMSDDMLMILQQKKEQLSLRVSKRIRVIKGNIFKLDINEKYDFVFLPATTLSILFDDKRRVLELFNSVAEILNDNGSFAFDIRIYDDYVDKEIIPIVHNNIINFSYEFVDKKINTAIGKFIAIEKNPTGQLHMYVAESNKKIINMEDIETLIKNTSFFIYKTEYFFNDGEKMLLVVLKRKEENSNGNDNV